jgi:hypothetical protein
MTVSPALVCRAAIGLAAGLAALLATARARACDEVSDVTGYRRCSSFGQGWDQSPAGQAPRTPGGAKVQLPPTLPLFVDFAATMHTVDAGSLTYKDTAANSQSFSLHNPGLGAAAAYGFELRTGFRVAGPLYLGVTFGLAFGGLAERATAVANGARVDLGNVLGVADFGALVGIGLPVSSLARVRIEVSAGGEDVGLLAISSGVCASDPCGPDSVDAFIEPRLMLDFWASRHWSVSPFAGDDVLHPSRVTLGVMGSWHWQAFDGRP